MEITEAKIKGRVFNYEYLSDTEGGKRLSIVGQDGSIVINGKELETLAWVVNEIVLKDESGEK